MPSKTEDYLALAQRTANGLTRYWESWTDYLTTASRLYKYPFADQLMIYAQRPDATACADFDIWNNRMNRYVSQQLADVAGKLVADYWDNNGGDIRAIVDGSLLMDEQPESAGRGTGADGADLQLSFFDAVIHLTRTKIYKAKKEYSYLSICCRKSPEFGQN